MTNNKGAFTYPLTGDLFRLLFLCASITENTILRKRFLGCVDQWLELHAEDNELTKRFHQYLNSEKGTSLEPLVLEKKV